MPRTNRPRLAALAAVACAGVAVAAPAATAAAATTPAPPAVSTITLNAKGRPSFSPSVFRLRLNSPAGCDVTVVNATPNALAMTYGTPGAWKRLPFGALPAGASRGVGVGIAPFTGYFSVMGAANHVAVRCT